MLSVSPFEFNFNLNHILTNFSINYFDFVNSIDEIQWWNI